MKTIKLLEKPSSISDVEVNKTYNVSDLSYEALNNAGIKLEVLQDDESAPILSSDKIKWNQVHVQTQKKSYNTKTIPLPKQEMDLAFVKRLSTQVIEENIGIYYEPSSVKVVEITEWKDEQKERYIFGKRFVDALRLKAILENKFNFMTLEYKKNGELIEIPKSPSKQILEYCMSSNDFRESLKYLNGVFESPFLYIKNGELRVTHNGYNDNCLVYVRQDAPEVKQIDVAEAKKILNDCLLDFPFQTEQDKVFAIASIITPMLRGIYGQYGVRTPIFIYLANQQGCGKDYCAGIRQIIYTGRFNEDAPISNDKGSNSEEVDKVFVASALTGQQFMHFSNCRGHLQNASLEKHQTASSIRGRALATNIIIDAENILEVSLSGNYGLTFNKDVARRSLFVNLFTEVEDTTKRKFTRDLHQWIKENRSQVLSAIYTLIKTWWDAGHQFGDGVNASYQTWAKFCSGVMQFHGLGDPCASGSMVINDIGGDTETKNISHFNKELGDWLYEQANAISNIYSEHHKLGITKKDIFTLFQQIFADSDDRPFSHFDLESPKDRRELGRTINKYVGTFRGGYKLIVTDENAKSERTKYKFVKSGATGGTGVANQALESCRDFQYIVGINSTQLAQLPQIAPDLPKSYLQKGIESGEIVEVRPNEYRKVV